MKRTLALVAGIAALAVGGIYLGNSLFAQGPPATQPSASAQAPAQTRIAVVNTIQILKQYHKFTTFQNELKALADPFEKADKKHKEDINKWKEALASGKVSKEQAEEAIKQYQRAIEDNVNEGRKVVAKRSDEQLVQLFKEIEEAVQRYATSNGFHLVLQYDDGASTVEKYSSVNIQRKMNGIASTGCLSPIYAVPGMDITNAVVSNLNANAPAGVTPAGATVPPGKK